MLVEPNHLDNAYQGIVGTNHSVSGSPMGLGGSLVIVFVSVQCDSLAACRILTQLFREDHVQYSVLPVSGYNDLVEQFKQARQSPTSIRSVVMINCGGSVDLMRLLFEEDDETDLNFYVFDNHRPFDLANVRLSNQNVLIICDEEECHEDDYPEDESEDDSDDSDDSDDDSNDDESDEELDLQQGPSSESDDEMEGDKRRDDLNPNPSKRRRLNPDEELERRNARRAKRKKIVEYYNGTYFGSSSAILLVLTAKQLNRNHKETVWLSIIGVTDLYLHERILHEKYVNSVMSLTRNLDLFEDDSQGEEKKQIEGYVQRKREGTITSHKEYDLMLLRHWSIYNSMYHSKYIASRLGIWKENGQRKFLDFLAKMSLPLVECKQQYNTMDNECRDRFHQKLEECSKQYGLENISYRSFHKQHGPKCEVSAADMVYAATALLENDSPDSPDNVWEGNFWEGYDAIASNNFKQLEEGFKRAKILQAAIVSQGILLIEKKMVVCSGPFRYTIIDECSNIHLFIHHLTLTRLARFMLDAFQISMERKSKPFVICAFNSKNNTYLVVGIASSKGHFERNKFGVAFRTAAEKAKARIKHDGFESSYMEVQREDKDRFLEILHSGLVDI